MNKNIPVKIVLCSLLFAFCSLLLGCPDPFTPELTKYQPGKGSFSLSINVAERTILPAPIKKDDFVWYAFDFIATVGGTNHQEERASAQISAPFYLDKGTYTLEVTAYLGPGKTRPAASGSIELVIIEGQNTSGGITLKVITEGGIGSFTYTVNFPNVTSAKMNITALKEGATAQGHDLSSGVTNTLNSLAAGYYNVEFTLVKTNGETLVWWELLHIYGSLESKFTKTFYDADFYKTKYTVTFNFNGGEATFNGEQSVNHGEKVSRPSPDPTRTGYNFDDWYSNAACTGDPYNFNSAVFSNITLYANWNEVPVTNITLDNNTLLIEKGKTATLTATVTPSNATTPLTWTSDATGVATVNNSGTVTAVSRGTATITAEANGVNASCIVTVFEGSGTSDDPFLIYDETDLLRVGTGTADWALSSHYKVMESFTITKTSDWTPIGDTYSNSFAGNFDGDGNTISGLRITGEKSDYQGLFGSIKGGVVENLNVNIIINITGNLEKVGGIAGYAYNSAIIDNCSVSGSVSGYKYVGGVVGEINNGLVQNCSVSGSVSGTEDVGGVVGQLTSGVIVQNCSATGKVSGNSRVGGVVGHNNYGTVEYCYAKGDVSGNDFIGGVVGYNDNGTVQYCFATGNVSGTIDNIGGVVGQNDDIVQNCYAIGNVSGTSEVGGVVGQVNYGGTVRNCYATGEVRGNSNVGGVVGQIGTGTVNNCVALNANIAATGANYGRVAGYGTGLTNNYARNDMHKDGNQATWTSVGATTINGADITSANWSDQNWWSTTGPGFDFSTIWDWHSDNSLPTLRGLSNQKALYTVTFNSNGGTTVAAQIVAAGGTASSPTAPTRSGFTFDGWYTDNNTFNTQFNFNTTPITSHITLYAKWNAVTGWITITVEQMTDINPSITLPNGGVISKSGVNSTPTSITLTLANPEAYDAGSIKWTIPAMGAGQSVTGTGNSFIVDASDANYNSIGGHTITLVVKIDGAPYSKVIDFEVVP